MEHFGNKLVSEQWEAETTGPLASRREVISKEEAEECSEDSHVVSETICQSRNVDFVMVVCDGFTLRHNTDRTYAKGHLSTEILIKNQAFSLYFVLFLLIFGLLRKS